MKGWNYGLITAEEWIDQNSDTNEMLRDSKAQVRRATGYAGNKMFFVLAYFPESFVWANWDAIDWHEAPKGEDTLASDVLSPEEASREVLEPWQQGVEKFADAGAAALEKAAGIGSGALTIAAFVVGGLVLYQLISMTRRPK